jgi:hypothetical protein
MSQSTRVSSMDERKKRLLECIKKELEARGVLKQCSKCKAGPGTPCAYPDHGFRDCAQREQRKTEAASLAQFLGN